MQSAANMNSIGSWFLIGSFLLLPLLLLALGTGLLVSVTTPERRGQTLRRAALACAGWMLVWSLIGVSGILDVWDTRPPRVVFMLVALFGTSFTLALGSMGKRLATGLSLRTLIGIQAFRLPLELLMYRAAVEGLMPLQMSFAGYNYEIITGATALGIWLAFGASRRPVPHWVAWGFSALGLTTLIIILAIALASTPIFAAFGPERLNTWVTHFPYVSLPTVMVPMALIGHILIWRKLVTERLRDALPSGLRALDQG